MLQDHWNKLFSQKPENELGWYEKDSSQTLQLLSPPASLQNMTICIPGAGTSGLVDELASRDNKLIVNDISETALELLKSRLVKTDNITWLCGDITKVGSSLADTSVDLWIDRAVLHFLLEPVEIESYFALLKRTVRSGGYVMLAEFADNGATKCAGLELHRYSLDEMTERLGKAFELVKSESYTYISPSGGERPYIYALYTKKQSFLL